MAEQDFQKLLDLITKTSTEIGRLESRIEGLQKKLSGTKEHLGTGQIKEFTDQIQRLMTLLTEKRTQQTSFINQKDVLEANKSISSVIKQIETLTTKIAELQRQKANIGPNRLGFENDPAYYDREIKKLESALASARSRAIRQSGAGVVSEERLSSAGQLQGGLPAGTTALQGRNRITALGRDAASRMLNQIQNEILKGAIEARTSALEQTANAEQNRVLREYILDKKRALDRAFVQQSRQILTPGQGTSPANVIPGGYEERGAGIFRGRQFFASQIQDESNLRGADVSGLSDKRKEAEEALLKSLRVRVETERKYAQALEQAQRLGFTTKDLVRSQTRGVAGIEQLQFQRYDESGVQKRFDTFVNPSGRATPGVSNQFRTFGQGVVRDIGELTKWSIALAAVYGPMRKLQELTQLMIENQTQLAEAVTSVGSAFLDEADIFSIAADQAERAGEGISGVIDAFTQAFRATGGAGSDVERLTIANELLNDSLILSKLSTLDQASAIDTLSAALRQSGSSLEGTNNPLQRGTELLDKWVRVTKIANVDLASLATGFAVLGDSAEAAQIDIDQLNGLIGAIAETGVASGRELANTARAIVSGIQSDQAREALEKVGVAFETSTGQARPFMEIMKELSDLRVTGVLDDTAFSELTLALGGGTRRQAAFATLIENFSRVGEIAQESSRAAGDSQAALARQLETVQTSLTRLSNSFQELAQTLGTEGGFLGIITAGVDGMTSLVRIFDSLTSVLGKATPALAAFIATSLILRHRGQGGIQQALFGAGQGLGVSEYEGRLAGAGQGLSAGLPLTTGQNARSSFGTNVLGTNAASGIFQGLAASLIPAILNATNSEDRFGGTKAVSNVLGGIGGGVIGSLVAGSPVIGAAIGVAISEAFVNSTIARKTDLFGYTEGPTLAEPGVSADATSDVDAALEQAQIKLYESIGFGNESLGRLMTAGAENNAKILLEKINEAIASQDEGQLRKALSDAGLTAGGLIGRDALAEAGVNDAFINKAFSENRQIQFSPENIAFNRASPDAQTEFRRAEQARLSLGVSGQEEETPFIRLVDQNNEVYKQLLSTLKEQSKQQLSQDRISGDVRGAEYGRRTEALGGFNTKALQYYTALGSEVDKLTGGTSDAARAFEILNNVIIFGGEDSLPQITAIQGEIQNLINLLDDPRLHEDRIKEMFPEEGVEGAKNKLQELQETMAVLIEDANKQVILGNIQLPELVGNFAEPRTRDENQQIVQRGTEIQQDFLESVGLSTQEIELFVQAIEAFTVPVEAAGTVLFDSVSGLEQRFYQLAESALQAEGALKSIDPFGIQQIDLPGSQAGELQNTIDYFSGYLAENFPQYEQKPEEFGVIFNDYVTSVLHGDNLAVKLALEKLVDINQKQLDGMYNIPEGATFWVPLTAAYYRPQNEGAGAGGLPAVDAAAVDGNTTATEMNTTALMNLSDKWNNMDPYLFKRPGEPHEDRYDKMNNTSAPVNREQNDLMRGRGYDPFVHEDRYDKMNQPSATTESTTFLQNLQNWLRSIFTNIGNQFPTRPGGPGPGGTGEAAGGYRGLAATTAVAQPQPLQARLDFRIDQNTQLIVDGRVLASVITPYLAADLLRLEASQGTITRRYVI
jgi:TP901 family phage tail tape measure protein